MSHAVALSSIMSAQAETLQGNGEAFAYLDADPSERCIKTKTTDRDADAWLAIRFLT